MTKERALGFLNEVKNCVLEKHPEFQIEVVETSRSRLRIDVNDENNEPLYFIIFEEKVKSVKKKELYYHNGKKRWRTYYNYIHDKNFQLSHQLGYKLKGFKLLCEAMEYIEKTLHDVL